MDYLHNIDRKADEIMVQRYNLSDLELKAIRHTLEYQFIKLNLSVKNLFSIIFTELKNLLWKKK